MCFVRTAGCNVGYKVCGFCDTEFTVKERLTPIEIAAAVGDTRHICFTGGEPFLHDLAPFMNVLLPDRVFHIETSGTIDRDDMSRRYGFNHISCSPKPGWKRNIIHVANDIKILIGAHFEEEMLANIGVFRSINPMARIFFQPVNNVHLDHRDMRYGAGSINQNNLKRCMVLARKYDASISPQWHKFLGME